MRYGLISLFPLQIARLFGLVRVIEPVQVFDGRASSWVLVVRGRGFTRVLRDEPLPASSLIRPDGWNTPRPLRFPSEQVAVAYARSMGLLPQRTNLAIKECAMQADIQAQGGAGAGAPEGVSGQKPEQSTRPVEYHIAYCAYGATGEGETLFVAVSGTQEHAESAFRSNVPEYWRDHMTLDVIGEESSAATRSITRWIPQAALDLIARCPPGTNFYFAIMHCNLS